MTAVGWMALAAAAVLAAGPGVAGLRAGGLAAGGRLAAPGAPAPGAPTPARAVRRCAGRVAGGPAAAGPAAVAVSVVAVGAVAGPALAAAAAAVTGTGWVVVRQARARRRVAAGEAELAIALGVLVAELEAGGRPADALLAAAGAGPRHGAVLGRAATAAAAGADAAEPLLAEAATRPLGHAWRLGERTGAPLAGVLARVSADLAAAAEQRRSVAVALAGPRSSATLLTGLPLVGVALGTAMEARPAQFLLTTPAGSWVCCVGVLLDAAGVLWMARILRQAAQS